MIWPVPYGKDADAAVYVSDCLSAEYHYDATKICPKGASEIAIQSSIKERIESSFQAAVVAIPNGTFIASHAGRSRAKREGLAKGFPDLMVIGYGRNEGKICYLEVKAKKQPTWAQHSCLIWLWENNYKCGVFRSQDTVFKQMRKWGWV